ncbi:late secretory pathway protein AVL9 homolog [Ctenocephalides felis]|uniref:late secretory pathway protein AVL9 homolog n=1 Tax=Ctenocephalides felis TaxID=7515 RepID=UPI000E6E4F71|nr:late secretory pathway protein AVL9 homolog [Ctenocephalides felis]
MSNCTKPILHIIVIGFHHKKGCQIEYSYPPLEKDDTSECPTAWKYLPTLALPDGSHNFTEDSVFFHLPGLQKDEQTIFGVSCYRQLPVEKLVNIPSDVTRSTVQKSVCVLSTLPLYGHIEIKLALIAHAFFEQGDFSQTKILQDAYHNMNQCFGSNEILEKITIGLSVRDLVLRWRHKILVLFKLILLEKKVVIFGSPVRPLCLALLTILSLHPNIIDKGLFESANTGTLDIKRKISSNNANTDNINAEKQNLNNSTEFINHRNNEIDGKDISEDNSKNSHDNKGAKISNAIKNETNLEVNDDFYDINDSQLVNTWSEDSLDGAGANVDSRVRAIDTLNWGGPLPIFSNGYLCFPYLSLPYMELLTEPKVKGYIIGASNVLFRQKRNLADILIDVDNLTMQCYDPELRKQLTLSTEDLRFADCLVRNTFNPINLVSASNHSLVTGAGHDSTIGGEVWLRAQFQLYFMSMLQTAMQSDDPASLNHFNGNFVSAWRRTDSFKTWSENFGTTLQNLDDFPATHPCVGQLSVGDVKLRLTQTMQNSESGRKINLAVSNTSRAVGGALSQARGVFSNWWSSITTTQNAIDQDAIIATEKDSDSLTNSSSINNIDVSMAQNKIQDV